MARRFWGNVRKTKTCWLWKGCPDPQGYGRFFPKTLSKIPLRAHRFAYTLKHGEIPEGRCVIQPCGKKLCVRHLALGYHNGLTTRTAYYEWLSER